MKLEVGGEMVGEVTGDEVIMYPDAVALKWEYRLIRGRLGFLEEVAEGFGVLVSLNIKLFYTGEFSVREKVILMAFNMMKGPRNGTKVHDVPNSLNDVRVEAVGVRGGVFIADGVNGAFAIAI